MYIYHATHTTVLYNYQHTITHCPIQSHTIPYHTIPYHTIPYHTIPYHTIPYRTVPYHTVGIPCHTISIYVILILVLFLFYFLNFHSKEHINKEKGQVKKVEAAYSLTAFSFRVLCLTISLLIPEFKIILFISISEYTSRILTH
jgi:hypothetical protein